jgi:carbonic anhydrase
MHETQVQKDMRAESGRYSTIFVDTHLPATPKKHYIVVTCMDARIDPAKAFGVKLGDAHVIRNVSLIPPLLGL